MSILIVGGHWYESDKTLHKGVDMKNPQPTKSQIKRSKKWQEDWWLESNLNFDERAEFREIRDKLNELTISQERTKRCFDYIFYRLIQCQGGGKVVLNELTNTTGFYKGTIEKYIRFFVQSKLTITHRKQGISPTDKFFWFIKILQAIDPEKYNFTKP